MRFLQRESLGAAWSIGQTDSQKEKNKKKKREAEGGVVNCSEGWKGKKMLESRWRLRVFGLSQSHH